MAQPVTVAEAKLFLRVEHEAEDGWHDEYRHHADHHGMPEDEEWTQPEDAVTGDPPDDIPEEERKRMHDENGNRDV